MSIKHWCFGVCEGVLVVGKWGEEQKNTLRKKFKQRIPNK
jgi:hypothetical protein